MTSMVTAVTRVYIEANSSQAVSTTVGAVVILLLLTCLLQKEVMRAAGGARAKAGMQALDVVVAPLVIAFALIIALRFLDIVRFGRFP